MSSKSHFFRGGFSLPLIADYQFNNNLIDSIGGNNLTGTNVSFNNGNAVFNGINSDAKINDTTGVFSFTDGVNDLPFRIETSVSFSNVNKLFQAFASKRGGNTFNSEWQLYYDRANQSFSIALFSLGGVSSIIIKSLNVSLQLNTTYNIVVDYNGSSDVNGLNIYVNNIKGTISTVVGNYVRMNNTGSTFDVGKFGYESDIDYKFSGEMDYLKIYK